MTMTTNDLREASNSLPRNADAAKTLALPYGVLKALSTVTAFASRDEARPLLTCVLIEVEAASVRFVATDSYRLAVLSHEYRDDDTHAGEFSALVPAKFLIEAVKSLKCDSWVPVTLTFAAERVTASVWADTIDEVTRASRLIEGTYPAYRGLMPEIKGISACDGIGFSPYFLADFAKLAPFGNRTKREAGGMAFKIANIADHTRPVTLTAEDTEYGVSTTGLLMPVRLN